MDYFKERKAQVFLDRVVSIISKKCFRWNSHPQHSVLETLRYCVSEATLGSLCGALYLFSVDDLPMEGQFTAGDLALLVVLQLALDVRAVSRAEFLTDGIALVVRVTVGDIVVPDLDSSHLRY